VGKGARKSCKIREIDYILCENRKGKSEEMGRDGQKGRIENILHKSTFQIVEDDSCLNSLTA
jgi:hypothetical protein